MLVAVVCTSAHHQSPYFSPFSLSGTHVSATHGLLLVLASFAVYLMPTIAVVCIGLFLSAVTRNSAAAVVGTLMAALLMQLIGILPGLGGTEPYLLTTQFQAWQGFFQVPTDWLPIGRAAWVCAMYAVPMGVGAYLISAFLVGNILSDTWHRYLLIA